MRRKNLIINTFLLTFSTMILGLLGMLFRIYLSNKIGSEGMGLFQLIMSINVFASTISISGIRLTLTRLVAEEIGKNNKNKVKYLLKCGFLYTLFFSTMVSFILYSKSFFISETLIGDIRARIPLQILALSMPFVGVAACFNGYFYGCRKVVKSIFSDFIESITMIAVVAFFVTSFCDYNLEHTCCFITIGMSLGNIAACFSSFVMYLLEKRSSANKLTRNIYKSIFREVMSVSLPIAGSAYVQTFLKFIEDILIPKSLNTYGSSTSTSLSIFGMIKGMALPLLNFPSIFLASFSTLIIPEIAQYNVLNKPKSVNFVISKVIKFTLIIAFFSTGFFMTYSNELGLILYKNTQVGIILKILAPLIPLMYLDRIVDGSLNALNQQVFTLRYNFIDMTVRIFIINIFIPRLGIDGFILVLFVSTILNFSLSVNRLLKVTKLYFSIADFILKPSFSIFISTFFVKNLFDYLNIDFLITEGVLSIIIYITLLFLSKCISKNDIMWFVDAFKKDPRGANWNDLNLYRQI
ncbi:MAG: oligosaccharide flippase family protein [Intestinibacter sp.]|uniref:oligosaccharide flippase family protein n=3 Tax=Intestinibacter sp. TaxID=1965304 RepID=UPI002A7F7FE9|nr:oligosaccharide flippase family protein [Intestinibacter sp.]MDY4573806.1 oligosaccharide flippase family protein [Intestinibacter sp.]